MLRGFLVFLICISSLVTVPADGAVIALGGDVALNWRGTPGRWIRFPWDKNPFRRIAPILKKADFSIANMEGVLMKRNPKYARKYNLWARSVGAQIFRPGGIHLLSHANNHTFDGRARGVLETLRHLRAAGVKTFGSGPTEAAARAPYIWKNQETCVAFIPATTIMNKWIGGGAHVAMYRWNKPQEQAALIGQIRKARTQCPRVVVYIHWGRQYSPHPVPWMRSWAHRMIDAGAHAVIGHHTHVLGAVEHYRGRLIAYSLGNLVFSNPREHVRRAAILFLEFDGQTQTKAWFEPIYIERPEYVPRRMNASETRSLVQELKHHSKSFNTRFAVQRGVITIQPGHGQKGSAWTPGVSGK